LRLYSFARNLSAAFYVAFLYGYAILALNAVSIPDHQASYIAVLIPAAYLFGSLVMLSRYYYLYANYYTKFIIRAFFYSVSNPPSGLSHTS
jgi:hypothetical protein